MLRKHRTHQTPITAEGWSSYLQQHSGPRMSNCSLSPNRADAHVHGMGSCLESIHYQEVALHTFGPAGMHPTRPAGSVPHIPHQPLSSPMGSCPESTFSRRHGPWDSISRGVESVLGAVHGVAQRVTARWTDDSRATARDIAVPLGRNNPPTEQLFHQGAESWTSPGFDAIDAPFIKYAEKRVPARSGKGTDKINVLAPYHKEYDIVRLFAAMMEQAEIPSCWKAAKIIPLRGGKSIV
eukprot:1136297-Pelagomonas_calceolata.AAC.2